MSEQEFWGSPFKKINFILNTYTKELAAQFGIGSIEEEIPTINSMKEIPGW